MKILNFSLLGSTVLRQKIKQSVTVFNESHLRALFVVQSKAANGVTVPDSRRSCWALQTKSDRGRKLSVELVGKVPHHTQRILQTLNVKKETLL